MADITQPGSAPLPPAGAVPEPVGEEIGDNYRLIAMLYYEVSRSDLEDISIGGEAMFELPSKRIKIGPFLVDMWGKRINVYHDGKIYFRTREPKDGDMWFLFDRAVVELNRATARVAYALAPLEACYISENTIVFIKSFSALDNIVLESPNWVMTFGEFFIGEGESPQFVLIHGNSVLVFWISANDEGVFDLYHTV